MTSQLSDFAANQPKPGYVDTAGYSPAADTIARLEAENKQLKVRAEEAEDGWHGALLKLGRPEQRQTHEVLVSIANLAEEQLGQLKHLVARAAAGESRSSATVKDSTRGVDLEVKSYGDGLLEDAITDAVEGYRRGRLKLAELQANQWQGTVAQLAEAKKGGEAA